MSQRYPCPNPVCAHEFSPADLAGAAALTCPQCGMVIQLRAAPAPVPMARPVNPVPRAVPAAGVPMARPVVQPAAAPDEAFAAPIVRTRKRRSRDWLTYSLFFGFLIMMGALLVVGLMVRGGSFSKIFGGGSGYKNSDYNFNFDPKVSGWERNNAMKAALNVSQLALMRESEPNAYFAIDVVDYKDHTPSARELDDEARKKLKSLFPRNFETDPPPEAPPKEAAKIAGQATHGFRFSGQDAERAMEGEVAFFGNQGLGYWFYWFAAGDGAKQVEQEIAALKKGFALLGERADWAKVQKQRVVFTGDEVKGYQLADTTGRWKKLDDPKGHDPQADLALHADDPAYPRRPVMGADLIVMSIKGGGDPVAAARKHIQAKHERDAYPGTRIGDAGDEKDRVGEVKGHLLRWRVNNGGGRERFAIVGVVPRGEDLLVLYGECAWERRVNWETQLQQIVESLELKD